MAEARLAPPALTIIGKVVSLRPTMNWFESRPLFGQHHRRHPNAPAGQRPDVARLEELGANVIEAPTIELFPPADWSAVDEALAHASATSTG